MNLQEQKNKCFELGRAVFRFLSKKNDKYEYTMVCRIASTLGLEVPDADEFFKGLTSTGLSSSTEKWFRNPGEILGDTFANCYTLGLYSEGLFVNYLFYLHTVSERIDIHASPKEIKSSAERLLILCAEEGISREIIDDYLKGLKNSFGVPKEKREKLEAEAEAVGIFLQEDDPVLRGNIREIGDAKAVHSRFVQQISDSLLGKNSSKINSKDEIFWNLSTPPDAFDKHVSEMLRLTINETSVCYKHECYLATIALCGKIIETLLANAFQALMGKPPSEKMSFGDIRAALRGKGAPLDDSVDELLNLIYTHRSVVIHRGNLRKISFPTEGQAKHVAGLTQEVINILYSYFNDLTDE